MNKQTLWVATEKEGEIHCTEILLTDDAVLMIDDGVAVLRNFHKPREIIVLGEPLSFVINPNLFKLAFSISAKVGERAICHPLEGPEYRLYTAGQG